jgi:23S rRNA pseudouridine2605 synthase
VTRHGLARTLSKLGICSRTEAARWILDGRVAVDGRPVRDPEFPIEQAAHSANRITVDGQPVGGAARICVMLNKPRGLVTSARDEQGRETVYRCLEGAGLPWLAPVGRLDKASEGMLLFSNDPQWAAAITDPAQGPDKTYHVQIDRLPTAGELQRLRDGIEIEGERLCVASVQLLRQGERNAWLEIVLEEGRNRQIRRLLAALDVGVLRLVRVAIGELPLGALPSGQWRVLSETEQRSLVPDRRRS